MRQGRPGAPLRRPRGGSRHAESSHVLHARARHGAVHVSSFSRRCRRAAEAARPAGSGARARTVTHVQHIPNGPVLGIVPPLTRSVSTVGNGAIALSKTNSFDSNGRVTGFVARSAGGTITMRDSAWDALGRPAAGTMQSPAGASTQTITDDDNARTMTEVLTTRGITSTMASTVTRGQGSFPARSTSSSRPGVRGTRGRSGRPRRAAARRA